MTAFDWADRHWIVAGWCLVVITAGLATILRGLGSRLGGCDCVPCDCVCDLEHVEEDETEGEP